MGIQKRKIDDECAREIENRIVVRISKIRARSLARARQFWARGFARSTTVAYFSAKMALALEFSTFGRVESTRVAQVYLKMTLALEFRAVGREKSTTVAHFRSKVSLALGFWGSDVRHSRLKSSVSGPDCHHSRLKS